ncbi:MAG: Bor family protein [Flavobacteriales bacterium]|nr:Bor family protein [Flavobacteriales bacterium]
MKNFLFFGAMVLMLSSCYTHTYMVGNGPQTGVEVKEKNHFVVYGLVPIATSNPHLMAGGAENYQVMTSHTFIDGLINSLTFGIYNPTTTVITK